MFFGGGTPSLVPGDQLGSIVEAIPRHDHAEVTVECNPDTVSAELFSAYRKSGVTRISFGVQSMVDRVLLSLGRSHDTENVKRGVELARSAGFSSFNLDLIYGGAGESLADWESTIRAVIALEPPHISAYALTIESGTPLAADVARHPDDDDQADKYELAEELFTAAGYANYEISNWAKPGHQCQHNLLYWRGGDYRGFGCAAHSYTAHADGSSRRWWNHRTPERYIEAAFADQLTETAGEDLDAPTAALERLQLLLRTSTGVDDSSFAPEDLAEFDAANLTSRNAEDRVVLTVSGRLMANTVLIKLRPGPSPF